MKRITIRLNDEDFLIIENYMEETGLDISKAVRELIKKGAE